MEFAFCGGNAGSLGPALHLRSLRTGRARRRERGRTGSAGARNRLQRRSPGDATPSHRFSALGLRTCLVSPAHLRWMDGRAEIHANFASGSPKAVVRFFPAEWLPNLAREDSWRAYFQKTRVPVSNPGSSILLQTKRFPLVWEELHTELSTWRKLLPGTVELSEIKIPPDDTWVLKPALGRVGERIGIRGVTPKPDLEKIIREAQRSPQQWVAQKRFEILPITTPAGEKFPCIGVFTVGGRAAGFYGRIADKPIITQDAQDVAVLIKTAAEGKIA